MPLQSQGAAEGSSGPAIELQEVTKSFGSKVAVDNLSLSVPRGSVYGFIGPNGSGKTTTIRMLMNIYVPDRGRISVLGSHSPAAVRNQVSYLPEERGLYKKMTVRRLLEYYGQLKGRTAPEVRRGIGPWLERMGLTAQADKRIETLSKGMSQKVQFIAAVISEPLLVILDEPFSGLDPVNAEVLKAAVLDLRKRGVTILFSTHDMAVAEKLCDRICMIFKGKPVFDGTLDEIQATYGLDTIRVRVADPGVLATLSGVQAVIDHGNFQELRFEGDPQLLLRALVARTSVLHFELTRPNLHEIFVRIARPEGEGEVYSHA